MNASILNRDFKHPADGWYQIEAKGNHPNRIANVMQVIDEEAVNLIANRFNADAAAGQLRHGNELLIDHEHFSDQPDQETRAYGWLQELKNREDGIYGRIRWTATGQAAVDGGDYRFFSTEYDPAEVKILNDGKAKRIRPLRLGGLSLTNMHNNRGQKPITNRKEDFRTDLGAGNNNNQNQRQPMKSVCSLLGLSADASEESILEAVTKIRNRATTAETDLTPLKNRVTALEGENTMLLAEQIDADFATAGIKDDKIINRHKPLLSDSKHFKNRAERLEFIQDLAKSPATQPREQTRLLNRETKPPGTGAVENKDEAKEKAIANKITNRAAALRKEQPNLTLATAYRMAQNEIETAD